MNVQLKMYALAQMQFVQMFEEATDVLTKTVHLIT